MTILVTGANGFVGSNLCRHLLEHGYRVRGLVRPGGERRFIAGLPGLSLFSGDILEPGSLAPAMRGVDVVCHVAGRSADWGPWQAFRAANVDGVARVLSAARGHGVRRLVHVSSVSVYGFPGGVDLDEDTPFVARPTDRYVTTKADGERLALAADGDGIEVTVIRPGGILGPNDRTTTLKLAPALQAGRFAWVDGGRHRMAPLYIDNLSDMIRLAAGSPEAPGEAFNAVDDGHTSWREFIEWMCADLDCKPPRLSLPRQLAWPLAVCVDTCGRALRLRESPPINRYRLRAVMNDSHYANTKAKRRLGWQPSVSTREGVARAVRWYLDQSTNPPLTQTGRQSSA